jgi:pimeloyl-ACP methyl ester carboxylesterase
MREAFEFHVGYDDHLHRDPLINFQLNRWISYLGEGVLDELKAVAPRLADIPALRQEFLTLAEKAQEKGRNLQAAYFFRSAEFFMRKDDPLKESTRRKFKRLLWEYYQIDESNYHEVPYKDGTVQGLLPAYIFPHARQKDTIIIHGGFDSYIEEFLPVILYIRDHGYNVICFEGPGQGGALHASGLFLTHEWHKPVGTILDYFKLDKVTLIGISMGACLGLRAAAFEPRIKRVIAYDVFFDWMDTTLEKLKPVGGLLKVLLNSRAGSVFNLFLSGIMKKSPLFDWSMHQAMLVLGVSTPYQVFQKSRQYTTRDISSLITQDALLLAGSEDHVIPLSHFYKQSTILKNVKSQTSRLFTREEQAQNHCQIGNLRLAVDYIANWIDFTLKNAK